MLQALKEWALEAPGGRADSGDPQREQLGQRFDDGLGGIDCRPGWHAFMTHPVGRGPAPWGQLDAAALLELEQQTARRHILELAQGGRQFQS